MEDDSIKNYEMRLIDLAMKVGFIMEKTVRSASSRKPNETVEILDILKEVLNMIKECSDILKDETQGE